MVDLTAQEKQALIQFKQTKFHAVIIGMLGGMLKNADRSLRIAKQDQLLVFQGRAQQLDELLKLFNAEP